MKITRAADYSVRALIYLGARPGDGPIDVGEIAEALEVPRNYLVKVFKNLVRAGMITSYRGAHGGYALALPKSEINLRKIVEASDGPIALNVCLRPSGCGREKTCGIFSAWENVQDKLIEVMESYTLEDMSAPFPGKARGKQEASK